MKKNNKSKRKVVVAVALSLLAFAGGAFALPLGYNEQKAQLQPFMESPQMMDRFLQTDNLDLKDNFAYMVSTNQFPSKNESEIENITSVNEGEVIQALENEDYESWKIALENLEGFPHDVEMMSQEDFNILIELRKANKEGDFEAIKQIKEELGYDKYYPKYI